jgi:hypothetical protein
MGFERWVPVSQDMPCHSSQKIHVNPFPLRGFILSSLKEV